ncbi:uncharacterized protein LOC124936678 [Impatiens glandulifera]|uniref:uncharacterized protein LOC124936678 n=1 Tax=Impatiens glandulifera TaxID=253017 RepID=UPI001FB15F3A|nr:uncharacterized protein LOC124936678 [Impatiens glandulifera]
MESLIYSNTISSSRFHLKRSNRLTRLSINDIGKLGRSPPFCLEFRRFNVASSPTFAFARLPDKNSIEPLPLSSTVADSSDESNPATHFLKKVQNSSAYQQKAVAVGTVVLLSALVMILIHPVIVSPAFAQGGGQATAISSSNLFRTEILSSAWTGFLAGCLHTLSGPDHLAALAPLSIGRTKLESAAVGALWGCGHDAGQVIFGLLFLLLKDRLHIEILRTWGTRVVGFTLLVIGAMGIREASEVPTPCVKLENGECEVSGAYDDIDNREPKRKKKIGFATFATGIVHGLQPDALMMVLPALALPSRWAGGAFLGMFLVGTVIAMGSYTVFIGSCSEALKERVPRITEKLTWASSLIAIGLGITLLVSQFFGFSLY